ncbi:MAG: hypothetical protein IJ197_10920 [Bacteroidaceae bacterium]|nr:hypothetical protein [Bacteroidaceae bacterium]
MKRLLLIVTTLIPILPCFSQGFTRADELQQAYEKLTGNHSVENQQAFFDAFPRNASEFQTLCVVDAESRNADVFAYLNQFERLTEIPDSIMCVRLLNIAIGLNYDADGPNFFQSLLHRAMGCQTCALRHGGGDAGIAARKDHIPSIMFYLLDGIPVADQFRFWQFYWSSLYFEEDGGGVDDSHNQELARMIGLCQNRGACSVKVVTDAFTYFNGGVSMGIGEYKPSFWNINDL